MMSENLVYTGSGNGLLIDSTMPLTEPTLDLTYHQQGPLLFNAEYCLLKLPKYQSQLVFEIFTFEITATSPRGQWVNKIIC